MGGVLCWSNKEHKVRVNSSKILFNGKVGVHVVGEGGQAVITNNRIESNHGCGVKVGIAN